MEIHQPKPGKFGLLYGAIAAGISIIFTLMLMSADMLYEQSIVKSVVGILILVAVVIVAVYNFKKQNNGYLSLGQALGIGAITAIVAALISMLFSFLLTTYIVPEFWEKTAEYSRITMHEQYPQLTNEQIETNIEMQGKFSWVMYPIILLFNLFICFITALITGLILKKTENLD